MFLNNFCQSNLVVRAKIHQPNIPKIPFPNKLLERGTSLQLLPPEKFMTATILLASLMLPQQLPQMDEAQASKFAQLALKAIEKPYPYKPAHVWVNDQDNQTPRQLNPVFYGAYDWHSAVHGHWVLVRALRLFPNLPEKEKIRATLSRQFSEEALKTEAAYFSRPHTGPFERPYGWAWLLKLVLELRAWDDPEAKIWVARFAPLENIIVERYIKYFPKQSYAIRHGVHSNTAFGLSFAMDYARAVKNEKLETLLLERAKFYFLKDKDAPARWEPDGADFFSPSLCEADLMRRVLPREEFQKWLHQYLPGLEQKEPKSLFFPASVSDRTDPQIAHLDGLNLSRAWCLISIAKALPETDPARKPLMESASIHAKDGLTHVASGDYAGEHWLASFAMELFAR